jgi:hypothetical protein
MRNANEDENFKMTLRWIKSENKQTCNVVESLQLGFRKGHHGETFFGVLILLW